MLQLSLHSALAIGLWSYYIVDFFVKSTKKLAFPELLLIMYGLNFLLGPVITYNDQNSLTIYHMKIDESEYFNMAIPAIIFLHLGMNSLKTSIFKPDFQLLKIYSYMNEYLLKFWVILGLALIILKNFVPAEIGFFVYLLSGIRYVAAFGLYILNRKKYKWYIMAVLVHQLSDALVYGMFHDLMMWLIFFVILWMYIHKPSVIVRLSLAFGGIIIYFLLQVSKAEYRSSITEGSGGFQTFYEVLSGNLEDDNLLSDENYNNSVARLNQAWIFASTVNNMDVRQNFQHMTLVSKYVEAAVLPRFLAPNKLQAGDKEIFNTYSGHVINQGTSMGLGIFADGYIAYGLIGVYIFSFVFGLLLTIVFKIVKGWSEVSPFFVFFIFPILNYAVRPDCETQTLLGHLIKGLAAFGVLMWYYKSYFSRKRIVLQRTNFRLAE